MSTIRKMPTERHPWEYPDSRGDSAHSMSTPTDMTDRAIEFICADPHIDEAFKRGLRAAQKLQHENEDFHLRLEKIRQGEEAGAP